MDRMTPQERETYFFDPKIINWTLCNRLYVYGIQKFLFNQDVVHPLEHNSLIKKGSTTYFGEIREAVTKDIREIDHKKIITDVLNSYAVQNQI